MTFQGRVAASHRDWRVGELHWSPSLRLKADAAAAAVLLSQRLQYPDQSIHHSGPSVNQSGTASQSIDQSRTSSQSIHQSRTSSQSIHQSGTSGQFVNQSGTSSDQSIHQSGTSSQSIHQSGTYSESMNRSSTGTDAWEELRALALTFHRRLHNSITYGL